jgi:hypothetical protein
MRCVGTGRLIKPQPALVAGVSTIPGMLAPALVWESCAIALGVLKESPDTGFRPAVNYWISA